MLYCDAPGCHEEGQYETITVDGVAYDVIVGPKHQQVLREMASWGRPSRVNRAKPDRRRKDTTPRRLMSLLDADSAQD